MGLLKKNLAFTVVLVVCILVFCAGAFLAFAESGKIGSAKQKITSAESQLNNLRFADPAPTQENVELSEENVEELRAELLKIREELQRGARITTSSDGIGVMAAIQQYISEFQRKTANFTHPDGEGGELPIQLPNDFAFGFDRYVDEMTPLEDPEATAILDKQRQILSYLLNKLYATNPHSIVSVQREILEEKKEATRGGSSSSKDFAISDAVSAREPGAIDTLAFRLSFTGYTESLRGFLNELAKFDLPIVVRSIEVERPSGSETVAAPTSSNNLDAIFGVFGGSSGSTETPEEAQKPVISENISKFIVTLEFIEIVLPSDSADENV